MTEDITEYRVTPKAPQQPSPEAETTDGTLSPETGRPPHVKPPHPPAPQTQERPRTIRVEGEGRATAPADGIDLYFDIQALDKDYRTMMRQLTARNEALEEAVAQGDFPEKSLKTTNFSVSAEYENRPTGDGGYERVFAGYRGYRSMILRFDLDMARLQTVLNAVSQSDIEPELRIRFVVRDPSTLRRDVLEAASRQARTEAEILCAAQGVRLGQLLEIRHGFDTVDAMSPTSMNLMSRAMGADAESLSMTPEDVEMREQVTCVWALEG